MFLASFKPTTYFSHAKALEHGTDRLTRTLTQAPIRHASSSRAKRGTLSWVTRGQTALIPLSGLETSYGISVTSRLSPRSSRYRYEDLLGEMSFCASVASTNRSFSYVNGFERYGDLSAIDPTLDACPGSEECYYFAKVG